MRGWWRGAELGDERANPAGDPFEEFFAQPASADDGSALGAALQVSVGQLGAPRPSDGFIFTGPEFTEAEIIQALDDAGLVYTTVDDIAAHTAAKIADGLIVGWFQDRMECGPRALGNRCLLADPRDPESKVRMNEKVKHREPFRPFAPSCLAERAGEYFASGGGSAAGLRDAADRLRKTVQFTITGRATTHESRDYGSVRHALT